MKLTSGFHLDIRLKDASLRRFSLKEPEHALKTDLKGRIFVRVGVKYGPW